MKRRIWLAGIGLIAALAAPGCSSPEQTGLFVDALDREGAPEFVSYSGDRLWYLLDTMGSGVAVGDYDGDGRADIFWLSGFSVTDEFRAEALRHGDRLWRNEGEGRFRDVTRQAGLDRLPGWSNGAVFVDYDGDADLDLFVARYGPNLLFRNRGDGTFEEVASKVGLAHGGFGAGAAFFDADGDGDLDLYLTNYAIYDAAALKGKVKWFTDGVRQFPAFYDPEPNVFYRNEGDGTFTDITAEAGDVTGTGHSLSPLAFDYDDDGDVDVFVANDIGYNDMLCNQGDGTFVNVAFEAGLATNEDGQFEACMGAALGDYDNDGLLDIIVTNFEREPNTLYRNLGGGLFVDATRAAGLRVQPVVDAVGWGVGLQDLDNDGHLDALFVNGHIVTSMIIWYMGNRTKDPANISRRVPQMSPQSFQGEAEQRKRLFLGRGDGTFEDVTDRAGEAFARERMGRGAAFADLDADGRLDVAVSNKNDRAEVLLNRMPARGAWLQLDLRAPAPNTFAVGALVRVQVGEKTLTRPVAVGSSYLSSDDRIVHVGLGPGVERADRVEVRWPDGRTETFVGLEAGRRHVLRQGDGEPTR